MTDGYLVRKMAHHIALTEVEKRCLAKLERSPKHFTAGETVIFEGEESSTLYIVKEGWLFSSNVLANGARQILQLYYPGDIVGTASVAFAHASASVTVGDDSLLFRVPKRVLGELFSKHPRLAALFYAMGMLENILLSDRLKMLGSTSGKGKLGGFILEILGRMRTVAGAEITEFELKLTQSDIGDALGMTQIHVNRLFRQLEQDEQAIQRYGRNIRILREDRLRTLACITERSEQLDTSWFPESSA